MNRPKATNSYYFMNYTDILFSLKLAWVQAIYGPNKTTGQLTYDLMTGNDPMLA